MRIVISLHLYSAFHPKGRRSVSLQSLTDLQAMLATSNTGGELERAEGGEKEHGSSLTVNRNFTKQFRTGSEKHHTLRPGLHTVFVSMEQFQLEMQFSTEIVK